MMNEEPIHNRMLRNAAREIDRKANLLCEIQKMREALSRNSGVACKIKFHTMYCEFDFQLMGEDTVERACIDKALCDAGQYIQSELALRGRKIGDTAHGVDMKP